MYVKVVKPACDVILSIVGLPLLLLLIIPISILIKLDDRGPVFFLSPRAGKNGKCFKMYKFRTMIVNAPDIRNSDRSTYNAKDDTRVTKIGRHLRELSLDEIPQLINIVLGNMSIIGPRPNLYNPEIPENLKLRVKPGITGYNQAYFRNESSREEKIENDLYYIENISFRLDLRIFLKTIKTVLSREKTYRKV